MKQYQDLLRNILQNGREKESGRSNMPNTFGLSRGTILMENVEEKFPLLTTKKMYLKGIILELLWFLRGETNIKHLIDNDVNIWNGDAYRWYLKKAEEYNAKTYKDYHETIIPTIEEFLEAVKSKRGCVIGDYRYGDLGKVYGYQWRNQNGVDQIKDIINELKNNPYGRYKILDGWNKRDFPEMALPPCHLLYQFIVRPMTFEERLKIKHNLYKIDTTDLDTEEKLDRYNIPKYYLDLNMYQRSCDTLLGVPFNIASMSILLMIMAKVSGMVAGDAFWIGGDTHIYVDHVPMVNEQLNREPYPLPKLIIKKELKTLDDILALTLEDFELVGYKSHPVIKAELFTGLKK
jgi:thymidylate synthase